MKFIFDFDDVLFNTGELKERTYACLRKIGVPRELSEGYYKKIRHIPFSLKKFIKHLLDQNHIQKNVNDIYEEIMSDIQNLVNVPLIDLIKKIGKENCFVVTYGEYDYNFAKLQRSGITPFFKDLHIVQGTKKEIVEKICKDYKDEKIFFIDDMAKHFKDLDMSKCPNLKTILYDETGLEKLKAILSRS